MRVYVLWEKYQNLKWVRTIYLSRESAERFKRTWPNKDLHIEEYNVLG